MLASPIWANAPSTPVTEPILVTLPGRGEFYPLKIRRNILEYGRYWDYEDNDWEEASWEDPEPSFLGVADSWLAAMAIVPPIAGIEIKFHWRT